MARLRQNSSFKEHARYLKLEFDAIAPGGIWSKRTGKCSHDGSYTGDLDSTEGLPPITFKKKWKWYTWRHQAFGGWTTPQHAYYGGMVEPVDVGDF